MKTRLTEMYNRIHKITELQIFGGLIRYREAKFKSWNNSLQTFEDILMATISLQY